MQQIEMEIVTCNPNLCENFISVLGIPYAYYAEDWIGVMPSDRHYRMYANLNCGVTMGNV